MRFPTLALLLIALGAAAQGTPIEEEAPTALFDIPLWDSRMELFFEGSWTARASAGFGFGWDAAGIRKALSLAEITRGLVFAQEPNIQFRVLIDQRWLSELRYTSGAGGNTFLLGYRGRDFEPLRYVNLGTSPLTIPGRAGLTPSPNRAGTAAMNFGLGSPDGNFDFLAQYEARQETSMFFRGRREVILVDMPISSWVPRRYFRLPSAPLVGLRFLAGTSGSWRETEPGEVVADPQTGLVFIPVARAQTYVARWDGFAAGTDPVTLAPRPTIMVGPDTWLVVSDGPSWSGVELKNRYPFPSEWREGAFDIEVSLQRRGIDVGLPQGVRVTVNFPARHLILEGSAPPGPDYPFFSLIPDVYAPGGETREGAQGVSLRIRLLRREEGFRLGSGVKAGSVRAFRNGLPYHAFTFNPETGVVSVADAVFSDDNWEFRFLRQAPDAGANRLFVWQGSVWNFQENHRLESMSGLQWTLDDDAVTRVADEALGTLLSRLKYSGKAGPWNWEVEVGARAEIPDATGRRIWEDWSGDPGRLTLDGSSLRPGALPPQNAAWGSHNPGSVLPLAATNRGRLRYRDYFSRDVFGNTILRPFGASGVGVAPYAPGAPVGPYLALGGLGSEKTSAVMEYELTPTRRWVSAQFFLAQGAVRDLSGIRVLRFTHRLDTSSPNLRFFLVAGTLGEDPDGTGVLRGRVAHPVEGLPWTDIPSGFNLVFPTPGAFPVNTGWQGKTWYQGAMPTAAVSREISLPGPGWSTVAIPLTEAEAKLLAATNSVQVVLVSTVAADLTGVYQIQSLEWEGCGAAGIAVPPSMTPPRVWEAGGILRTSSSDGPWEVRIPLEPLGLTDYRRLRLRLRAPVGPSPLPLGLHLLDAQDRGLVYTFTVVPGPAWQTVELNLETRRGSVGGLPQGTLNWDPSSGDIRLGLLRYNGTVAVEVELDDLEALDSLIQWAGDARGLLRWADQGQSAEAELRGDRDSGSFRGLWVGQTGPLTSRVESRVSWHPAWRWENQYVETLALGWLTLVESYSDLGSRGHRAQLAFPWFGTLAASADLRWTPWSTDQSFSLKHSGFLSPLWGTALEPTLALDLTQNARDGLRGDGTLELWPAALARLWRADPTHLQNRSWKGNLRLQGTWDSLEGWMGLKATSTHTAVEGGTLTRVLKPVLGVAWKPGPAGQTWDLRLEWSREASFSGSRRPFIALAESLGTHPESWRASWAQAFRQPFLEWFSEEDSFWIGHRGVGSRRLWGKAAFIASRPPQLGRLDFWLPAGLDLSWETAQEFLGRALPREPRGSLQVRWQALNQFGTFSAEPLTALYEQDEFFTLLRVDYRRLRPDPLPVLNLSLLQRLAFYADQTELSFDHSLFYQISPVTTWTWKGKAVLRWNFPVDFPLQVPYMRTPPDFQEKWVMSFGAETRWGSTVLGSGWGFQKILLEPKAEWFFHPFGVMALTVCTGWEILDRVSVTGGQIEFEIRVKF